MNNTPDRLRDLVNSAWSDRDRLSRDDVRQAVITAIDGLNEGRLRVAERDADGWRVNERRKKAVLLYFPISDMRTIEVPPFEYHDKIDVKRNLAEAGVRVVPQGIARHGSYLERGVVMMPSYVNIGAWVGSGTMVDTWATVGSCAQIGRNVHLSGGVGIGGVLEPVQASPVIIEDDCFIGSRCIIVEGVRVRRGAVLGANVVLTKTTRIIDVTGSDPVEHRGEVPERAVVIPGSFTKSFPAGNHQVPCALMIGERTASTDTKTSLNEVLRDFEVAV